VLDDFVGGGHKPFTVGDAGAAELPVSDGGLSVYVPEAAKPILDGPEEYRLRVGSGD